MYHSAVYVAVLAQRPGGRLLLRVITTTFGNGPPQVNIAKYLAIGFTAFEPAIATGHQSYHRRTPHATCSFGRGSIPCHSSPITALLQVHNPLETIRVTVAMDMDMNIGSRGEGPQH